MKIRHIYLFSSCSIQGISTRYRGVYVLKELTAKHKIKGTFIYPGYKLPEIFNFMVAYLAILFSFRRDVIVIYQKIYTKGIYSALLKILVRIRRKGTIYDTDDADYFRYYERNIYYFMKHCKMVTVGSEALEIFVRKFNDNVLHLTTPVISHREIKESRNELLHIGWIGDYGQNKELTTPFSHKISLNRILFPVLKELDFCFRLTILGIKNPADKIEIENYFRDSSNIILDIPGKINWLDENSVYKIIKQFDIGVSPMVDHEFNVAKSAFKAKQYLSCGVPVLASPIGENQTFIKDGFNGFLCADSTEFKNRFEQINEMTQQEYRELQDNIPGGLEDFSMEKYCETLLHEIKERKINC